jgi:MFS family permease
MTSTRKNVWLLAACQALITTGNVILIALNGLVGRELAPDVTLATLPVTAFVVGGALATMPVSLLMHRIGRVRGFSLGALVGMLGAGLCVWALVAKVFWLLCAGNLLCGMYAACAGYYRFAAADAAAPADQGRAISLVLAGGLVGGVLGPESSKLTKDLLQTPFLGSYVSLLVLTAVALVLVQQLDIPPLTPAERTEPGRALRSIARQPAYAVAVLGSAVAYAVMNLLMTATPLAMQSCHHGYSDAAFVIEWHVIAMFAPAFITGSLVKRFGTLQLMLSGVGLMLGCVVIAVSGESVAQFWTALSLLGVGWNFLYVASTTLLTESYRPAERARAQGLHDMLVFASMAVSSAAAGALVAGAGWRTVNYASVPFLALVTAAVVGLGLSRRRAALVASAARP